jgi:intein/homing endonuclease
MNSEKRPIKLSDIKVGNHVYVKGEFENEESDVVVAEKVYLLPRYITNKELDKFPFMKGKEE